VPAILPDGLEIAAICEREDPRDAFVSNNYEDLDSMPEGAKLGSSSLRRRLQVKRHYPRFEYLDLRGNVQTRLRKLDEGQYDAVILAVAGLKRLRLESRIASCIDTEICIPAAGQGAVGIECRSDDDAIRELLDNINHEPTRRCVTAERTLSTALEAHCNLPIGAFGELDGDRLRLSAFVSDIEGTEFLKEVVEGPADEALALGEDLCRKLLDRGARDLVAASRD
ncbi:MAG: hydroxymethylbilane synthase, partial [Pseudomonadales bacterium]|nr:hydroxymethylbilane synthase [Pseudomonadales bacterium]